MIRNSKLLGVLVGVGVTSMAAATPVQLSQQQFATQTAGLPTILESFDGFQTGTIASVWEIANGTYTGEAQILFGLWCVDSNCLSTLGGSFNKFPENTEFWGSHIIYAGSGNVLRFTVLGNSGSLEVDLPPGSFVQGGSFVGFHDPAGLQSVSFHILPGSGFTGNSLENVRTVARPILFTDGFED